MCNLAQWSCRWQTCTSTFNLPIKLSLNAIGLNNSVSVDPVNEKFKILRLNVNINIWYYNLRGVYIMYSTCHIHYVQVHAACIFYMYAYYILFYYSKILLLLIIIMYYTIKKEVWYWLIKTSQDIHGYMDTHHLLHMYYQFCTR